VVVFAELWVGERVQRALHTSAVGYAGAGRLHRSATPDHASVHSSFRLFEVVVWEHESMSKAKRQRLVVAVRRIPRTSLGTLR
jgi:hypothetical protein